MNNILICDDDKDIVRALKIYLTNPGYKLYEAYDGQQAVDIVSSEEIHLVLLDVMMPKMDGITALSKIREFSNVPIILLTAKSEDTDKILGLNVGADDYITKPFNPMEVVARVNSQLRRYTKLGATTINKTPEQLSIGGIDLDDISKTVYVDGELVNLTRKEYDILKLLMMSAGKVFSPKEIYQAVWKEAPMPGNDNTVAVHIRNMRGKIEINPNDPRYVKVIFGRGYVFESGGGRR